MRVADKIKTKIEQALQPLYLEVTDDSAHHAGHAGARPGGESHFSLTIVSSSFETVPRVKRHQMVYRILAEEMRDSVHALALTLLTPEEGERYVKKTV